MDEDKKDIMIEKIKGVDIDINIIEKSVIFTIGNQEIKFTKGQAGKFFTGLEQSLLTDKTIQ